MKKKILISLLVGLVIALGVRIQSNPAPVTFKIQNEAQFKVHLQSLKKHMKTFDFRYGMNTKGDLLETTSLDSMLTYTGTNNQIATIDEADIIKTNGKTTFYLDNNRLIVVRTDPNNDVELETILELSNEDNIHYNSLLLLDNQLILLGEQYRDWCGTEEPSDDNSPSSRSCNYTMWYPSSSTSIRIIDINKTISLTEAQSFDIEGSLLAARLKDDSLYLVTQKSNFHLYKRIDNLDINDVMPKRTYNNEPIKNNPSEISVLTPDSLDMMTLSKLDINNQKLTSSSYMGYATQVLLTEKGLLVSSAHYEDYNTPTTTLLRFDVDNDLALLAQTKVQGYLLNSFSMDYYDNHIRLAITQQNDKTTDNAIFVYDETLNLVGSLKNLGYDETIYSVLFKQEKAYVVTFKQIDPFFIIDLSNPSNPKVAGELKIPGYSSYLHQINQNTVVGFGKDVKFDEGSFKEGPFKVSLFDVSDPTSPKEKDILFTGDTYSTSDVMFDHKALMVDSTRNLLGFIIHANVMTFTEGVNSRAEYDFNQNFVLMKVNEDNLDVIINQPSSENQYFIRSIIVEDSLFIFSNESFILYDLNTLNSSEVKY